MYMFKKLKTFFDEKLNNKKEIYNSYKIEKFLKMLIEKRESKANENAVSLVLSQFAQQKQKNWFINKNITNSNKKWNSIFDTIAKNNITDMIKNESLIQLKGDDLFNISNIYLLFLKDLIKLPIEPYVFDKFLHLINEEDIIKLRDYKKEKLSFLAMIINSGRTDLMNIVLKRFKESLVFGIGININKHEQTYPYHEKQNFIGYIIDAYFQLPLCPEKEKDIKAKNNLKKMKEYYFENINKVNPVNDIEQKILDSQIERCVSLYNFMNTEHIEKFINRGLIKDYMVFKFINFLIEQMKYETKNKETELIHKLLNIRNIDLFDLHKLKISSFTVNQIDFITATNIFSNDEMSKSIMSLYFSFIAQERNIYDFYIEKINKSAFNDDEKDGILLLSLDVFNLLPKTTNFAFIMESGILKDIYSKITRKKEFQERLNKMAFTHINKLAYYEKYLRKLQQVNFNPYEKILYKGNEVTFKDTLEKIYAESIDKIFIVEKINFEKKMILSSIAEENSNEKQDKIKRRL